MLYSKCLLKHMAEVGLSQDWLILAMPRKVQNAHSISIWSCWN